MDHDACLPRGRHCGIFSEAKRPRHVCMHACIYLASFFRAWCKLALPLPHSVVKALACASVVSCHRHIIVYCIQNTIPLIALMCTSSRTQAQPPQHIQAYLEPLRNQKCVHINQRFLLDFALAKHHTNKAFESSDLPVVRLQTEAEEAPPHLLPSVDTVSLKRCVLVLQAFFP